VEVEEELEGRNGNGVDFLEEEGNMDFNAEGANGARRGSVVGGGRGDADWEGRMESGGAGDALACWVRSGIEGAGGGGGGETDCSILVEEEGRLVLLGLLDVSEAGRALLGAGEVEDEEEEEEAIVTVGPVYPLSFSASVAPLAPLSSAPAISTSPEAFSTVADEDSSGLLFFGETG